MQRAERGQEQGARSYIDALREQLEPGATRRRAVAALDELFAGGRVPDPAPDGFCEGSLLTTSLRPGIDALTHRVAGLWMPWLGKSFDREAGTGINVLTPSARTPLKMVWPSYEPVVQDATALQVFPFRTRIAPGELDPDTDVLKIDYDFEANPSFVIRRILDELVQVDTGFYLGKILYRLQGRFARIGFFTLQTS